MISSLGNTCYYCTRKPDPIHPQDIAYICDTPTTAASFKEGLLRSTLQPLYDDTDFQPLKCMLLLHNKGPPKTSQGNACYHCTTKAYPRHPKKMHATTAQQRPTQDIPRKCMLPLHNKGLPKTSQGNACYHCTTKAHPRHPKEMHATTAQQRPTQDITRKCMLPLHNKGPSKTSQGNACCNCTTKAHPRHPKEMHATTAQQRPIQDIPRKFMLLLHNKGLPKTSQGNACYYCTTKAHPRHRKDIAYICDTSVTSLTAATFKEGLLRPTLQPLYDDVYLIF